VVCVSFRLVIKSHDASRPTYTDLQNNRRQNPSSKHYDHRLIHQRLTALYAAEEDGDIIDLVSLIRSGLVRNLGNITASRLYNRAYGGTKLLIEDYVTQVARCINIITNCPTTPTYDTVLTSQMKLDVLHDTRLAFGRSVLVLQGGAIFGLCHLGVVKALHLRGLLPRIISGTATGALIAALVCVHTEDKLLDVLSGKNINVKAFTNRANSNGIMQSRWYETLIRRIKRWWRVGHFLDVHVLEELLRANIGDVTFEEAYEKTKRVLNITVTTSGGGGVPNLLNYITAPNVVRIFHNQPLLQSTDVLTAHLVCRPRLKRYIVLHSVPPSNFAL
jgi:TAG lipase/lysophosphatidylethanolamine acyltransferase